MNVVLLDSDPNVGIDPLASPATTRAREILDTMRRQRKQFEEKRVVVLNSRGGAVAAVADLPSHPQFEEALRKRRELLGKHLHSKEPSNSTETETTPLTERSTTTATPDGSSGATIRELPSYELVRPIPETLIDLPDRSVTKDLFRPKRGRMTERDTRRALSFEQGSHLHQQSLRLTKSYGEEPNRQEKKQRRKGKSRSNGRQANRTSSHVGTAKVRRSTSSARRRQKRKSRSKSLDNANGRSSSEHPVRLSKSYDDDKDEDYVRNGDVSLRWKSPTDSNTLQVDPKTETKNTKNFAVIHRDKIRRSYSYDGFIREKKGKVPALGLPFAPSLDSAFPPTVKLSTRDHPWRQMTLRDVEIPLELSPIDSREYGRYRPIELSAAGTLSTDRPEGLSLETREEKAVYLHTMYESPHKHFIDVIRDMNKGRGKKIPTVQSAGQLPTSSNPDDPVDPSWTSKDISNLSLSNEDERHELLRRLLNDLATDPKPAAHTTSAVAPDEVVSSSDEASLNISDESSCELTTTSDTTAMSVKQVNIEDGEDDMSCLTMPPLDASLLAAPHTAASSFSTGLTSMIPLPPNINNALAGNNSSSSLRPSKKPQRESSRKKKKVTIGSSKSAFVPPSGKPRVSKSSTSEDKRKQNRTRVEKRPHDYHSATNKAKSAASKTPPRMRQRSGDRPHRSVPARGGLYNLASRSGLTADAMHSRSSFTVRTTKLTQQPVHALRGNLVPTKISDKRCGAYNLMDLAISCGRRQFRHPLPSFHKVLYAIAEDEQSGS